MSLKARLRRWTLFLGVVQVTFGCIVGFIPPTAVPWFRGIVMAHIEFTANGVLVLALGLLLSEIELGTPALWAWFATVQIGTWTNGAAGWSGRSSVTRRSWCPRSTRSFQLRTASTIQ